MMGWLQAAAVMGKKQKKMRTIFMVGETKDLLWGGQ
jgi:hypothetical protein